MRKQWLTLRTHVPWHNHSPSANCRHKWNDKDWTYTVSLVYKPTWFTLCQLITNIKLGALRTRCQLVNWNISEIFPPLRRLFHYLEGRRSGSKFNLEQSFSKCGAENGDVTGGGDKREEEGFIFIFFNIVLIDVICFLFIIKYDVTLLISIHLNYFLWGDEGRWGLKII